MRPVADEKQLLSDLLAKLHQAKANKRIHRTSRKAAAPAVKASKATPSAGSAAAGSRPGGGSVCLTFKGEFQSVARRQRLEAASEATGVPMKAAFVPPEMNRRRRRRQKAREAALRAAAAEGGEGEAEAAAEADPEGEPAARVSYLQGLIAWAGAGPSKCIVRLRSTLDVRHARQSSSDVRDPSGRPKQAAAATTPGGAVRTKKATRRKKRTAKKVTAIVTTQKDGNALVAQIASLLRREFMPFMKRGDGQAALVPAAVVSAPSSSPAAVVSPVPAPQGGAAASPPKSESKSIAASGVGKSTGGAATAKGTNTAAPKKKK